MLHLARSTRVTAATTTASKIPLRHRVFSNSTGSIHTRLPLPRPLFPSAPLAPLTPLAPRDMSLAKSVLVSTRRFLNLGTSNQSSLSSSSIDSTVVPNVPTCGTDIPYAVNERYRSKLVESLAQRDLFVNVAPETVAATTSIAGARQLELNDDEIKAIARKFVAQCIASSVSNTNINNIQIEMLRQHQNVHNESDDFHNQMELNDETDALTIAVARIYALLDRDDKLKLATAVAKECTDNSHAVTSALQSVARCMWTIRGGLKYIIDLRRDLSEFIARKPSSVSSSVEEYTKQKQSLVSLDTAFKHVLQQQLHSGNLELRRITWASPAFTLEKLSEYEAVHAMTDWNDIKRRVGPGRRCYGFFGKSMPLEPLVFVQIALTSNLATSVQSILDDHAPWIIKSGQRNNAATRSSEQQQQHQQQQPIRAAIFYSITSQRGLAGVELGSTLIKRVMGELQSEFPSDLQLFSTLSPIPGLRKWLNDLVNGGGSIPGNEAAHFMRMINLAAEPYLQPDRGSVLNILSELVNDKDNSNLLKECISAEPSSATHPAEPVLLASTAVYLIHAKRATSSSTATAAPAAVATATTNVRPALDPVANFHLRNGACIRRINWLGDTSTKGLNESFGMMVNYQYPTIAGPGGTGTNSKAYVRDGQIIVHRKSPASSNDSVIDDEMDMAAQIMHSVATHFDSKL